MGSRDTKLTADDELGIEIAKYYADPLGYVMFIFPWDTDETIQQVELAPQYRERFPGCKYGPDVWACEYLDRVGAEVRKNDFNGKDAVDPLQFATKSGHGIGKSALSAWLIKWIMDTRPLSKGTVTANTAEQLKTKTWAELGKWHKRSLTAHWFDYTSGRGAMALRSNRLKDGESLKEEWFCTAQTCREENSEAFAGQHAPNATSFYVFDEASNIADKIFEVREGGTTDGEPMTFDFGNPTRNSGHFFEECEGRFAKRYHVLSIDSRNVSITNKDRIQRWLEDYGEDSDFFKVRVRGMFPSAGSVQFMPTNLVTEAEAREYVHDPYAPLIIGVDVARFGDDESVIYPRLGNDCRSFAPVTGNGRYRKLDTVQLTGKVVQKVEEFRLLGIDVSAIFVDGGGIGGGVVDQLMHLGYGPIEVSFGGSPTDANIYRYKSDEMWGTLRDKMPRLCLPEHDIDLRKQLTQRDFGYTLKGNKIHLETKKDMKTRLGVDCASPDIADALALTFAEEIAALTVPTGQRKQGLAVIHEYDPLDPPPGVG